MKITPMAATPSASTMNAPTTPSADAGRNRAIAMLTGQTPQVNQSAVAPEEMNALQRQPAINEVPVEETTEAPVEAAPAAEEPEAEKAPVETPLSRQHAILARQEKQLRLKQMQQNKEYETKMAEITARQAQFDAKAKEYESGYISKDRLKSDLWGVITEQGMSYDDIVQQIVQAQNAPQDPRTTAHIAKLEAKLAKLEAAAEESAKTYQNAQTEQVTAALNQIKSDVAAMVKADPAYETIRSTRSEGEVVDLIKKTWEKDGYVMSNEEAAQLVEAELTERLEKIYNSTEKFKKRFAANASPQPQKAQPAQTPATPKQPQPMKTLTNATSSTRQLSNRERALLAFEGRLKP